MTTFFMGAVLVVAFVLVMGWLFKQGKQQHNQPSTNGLDFELLRIEQAKQAAMDDIRRRRQYAEDQLWRLQRWSK